MKDFNKDSGEIKPNLPNNFKQNNYNLIKKKGSLSKIKTFF